MSAAESRQERRLDESQAGDNPIALFRAWYDEARRAGLIEPTAMALATADPDGRPSARMVLLKDLDDRGFVFFTNYESRKGHDLLDNPAAALCFWWDRLERQVRVEGHAERITDAESDAYFRTRPRDSQLGAWASPQSEPLESREALERRMSDAAARFADAPIPRPPHWGGYRLVPSMIEFWQSRPNRLHDRLRYTLTPTTHWHRARLAP